MKKYPWLIFALIASSNVSAIYTDPQALFLAVDRNEPKTITELLDNPEARAIVLDPKNIKTPSGTALHKAVYGDISLVNALLANEEARNVLLNQNNIKDVNGNTPLHNAVSADKENKSHLEIIKTLLANEEARNVLLNQSNIINTSRNTPLHLAAWYSSADVVNVLLLASKAFGNSLLKPEYLMNYAGSTPLHSAATGNNYETINALLENEEARNVLLSQNNIRDIAGNTPLHLAAIHGSKEVMSALLALKQARDILLAPKNLNNSKEKSALDTAKIFGKRKIMEEAIAEAQAADATTKNTAQTADATMKNITPAISAHLADNEAEIIITGLAGDTEASLLLGQVKAIGPNSTTGVKVGELVGIHPDKWSTLFGKAPSPGTQVRVKQLKPKNPKKINGIMWMVPADKPTVVAKPEEELEKKN